MKIEPAAIDPTEVEGIEHLVAVAVHQALDAARRLSRSENMAHGFGDELGSLLKQAQEMQKRVEAMQRELAEREVEGSAGGGAVQVVVTGHLELRSVKIDPAAVDPTDVEGLEDLVAAAVRQALDAARRLKESEMQRVTGGIDMPGLGF